MLASASRPTFSQDVLPATPTPRLPIEDEIASIDMAGQSVFYESSASEDAHSRRIPQVSQHATAGSSGVIFAHAYNEVQEETQSLEAQASSLKEMLTQLREAMSVIELQRAEFKGFLNGSKDALDRMEDWAGQAMGLNLRNSPDQVRRYLPLSVMWVSNSKLKKVLDLLKRITSGVQMTDEQLRTILQQLSVSILSCGEAFQQLQNEATESSPIFRQEPGWTPWEMQSAREEDALRERVTFERRGDLQALRSEIEATVREEIRREQGAVIREELRREQEARVREEIRREYENRPLTLAARTELEQQLRKEIRQEFEERRQLQESVSGHEVEESMQ